MFFSCERWHNENWSVSVVENIVANTTQDSTRYLSLTTTSHYNQLGILLFDVSADCLSSVRTAFLQKSKSDLKRCNRIKNCRLVSANDPKKEILHSLTKSYLSHIVTS